MAKLTVEWDHTPAEEWAGERWYANVNGHGLYIEKLPATLTTADTRQYYWRNSFTGIRNRADVEENLLDAMSAAIRSLNPREDT